jgi:RNA polymerase sigma factor (sigma-70 family)
MAGRTWNQDRLRGTVARVGTARSTELGVRLAGAREDALDDCYAELGPILRRYLRGRVPDPDIDDVVQVVFVEVWRFRSRFDPARSLEAWVLTIARRRAIDHLRSRRGNTVPLEDALSMAGPDGRDIASQVERSQDMQVALARLPDLQREAIEMAYYADLTQREIAERLDVPLGTIKARTARGLRRLGALIVSPAAILLIQPTGPLRRVSGPASEAGSASRCARLPRPGHRTGRSTPLPRHRKSALRAGRRRPR